MKLKETLFVSIRQNGSEWKAFILAPTNILYFITGIFMVNPLKDEEQTALFKDPVRTAQ